MLSRIFLGVRPGFKRLFLPGMVAQTFNPNTQEENLCEMEAGLVSTVSSRPAGAKGDLVSKNQKPNQNKS